MSKEEEEQYNYPEESKEAPSAESEEEMVQQLQAAGYSVSRQPQTPIQEMLPQPKADSNMRKGVIRQWAKKEYTDIKGYVQKKVAEQQAEKKAFKALPPEQQKAIRSEKLQKIKGFFAEETPTQQSQVQAGVMGQAMPQQQRPTMQMIMGDMFGNNQAPTTPQAAYPSQNQARRRIPPAGPPPMAMYGSVSAEPRYSTQQIIGNLFGEQQMAPPRRGKGGRVGMRANQQGQRMYGGNSTDMINRAFSFGSPPRKRTIRGSVRHSMRKHSHKRR